MERLQKFLSRAGVSSRRHAETMITDGRVKVNGKVVTELGSRVDAQKDLVLLDNKLVSVNSERKYFLFYKPPGVVTTLSDPEGRPTVGDYAKETGGRVFPVGRLDYDAEGALILTDDGELANKLMHPKHQVPRVYLAKVKGEPDSASLQKLVDGVRLEDGMANAIQAQVFEKAERNTWVKIVVTEGRQHLVKRLCAAIGHPVVRLYRPAHAGLPVHGLRPGELRELSHDEIRRVKAAADGDAQPEPALFLPARRHGHAAPGFEPEREEREVERVPEAAAPRAKKSFESAPAKRERVVANREAREERDEDDRDETEDIEVIERDETPAAPAASNERPSTRADRSKSLGNGNTKFKGRTGGGTDSLKQQPGTIGKSKFAAKRAEERAKSAFPGGRSDADRASRPVSRFAPERMKDLARGERPQSKYPPQRTDGRSHREAFADEGGGRPAARGGPRAGSRFGERSERPSGPRSEGRGPPRGGSRFGGDERPAGRGGPRGGSRFGGDERPAGRGGPRSEGRGPSRFGGDRSERPSRDGARPAARGPKRFGGERSGGGGSRGGFGGPKRSEGGSRGGFGGPKRSEAASRGSFGGPKSSGARGGFGGPKRSAGGGAGKKFGGGGGARKPGGRSGGKPFGGGGRGGPRGKPSGGRGGGRR